MRGIRWVFVFVLLFVLAESSTRFYLNYKVSRLAPAPNEAEGFGNFANYFHWSSDLSKAVQRKYGSYLSYVPETVVEMKPNTHVRIQNIEIDSNSIGLRSKEIKVYDFSDLFIGDRATAYIDTCHYAPHGCRVIGHALARLVSKDFLAAKTIPLSFPRRRESNNVGSPLARGQVFDSHLRGNDMK